MGQSSASGRMQGCNGLLRSFKRMQEKSKGTMQDTAIVTDGRVGFGGRSGGTACFSHHLASLPLSKLVTILLFIHFLIFSPPLSPRIFSLITNCDCVSHFNTNCVSHFNHFHLWPNSSFDSFSPGQLA